MTAEEIHKLYHYFTSSEGVFTDTRSPIDGGIFFALNGPNFNGNKFAETAIELGANTAVIDDAKYQKDDRYLLVRNTLEALQLLAHHHRSKFSGPVIAITGSNGKTTTKELISVILKEKYNLIATEGNLNNHIGVPITLLRISDNTELAIIEMGANHQGEIKRLCEIAEPNHGLITNIGKAHIEGFGSMEGIRKGKGELYDHLLTSNGVVFVNSSDQVLKEMASGFNEPIYYPNSGDFSQDSFESAHPFVIFKNEGGIRVETHLVGDYNFMNVATASCIGKYFEVPLSAIEKAISGYIPKINRSQVIEKGSNTIFLDAYNANPDSMSAALKVIDSLKETKKVVILGDMLELGENEIEEHKELGRKVKMMNVTSLFCGKLIKHSADEVTSSLYFSSKDKLIEYLRKNSIQDSKILIKASRGIGLETIVDEL